MPICTIIPNVLTKDECMSVIEAGKKLANLGEGAAKPGDDGYGDDSEQMRKCQVSWFSPYDSDLLWLYQKTLNTMRQANEDNWGFTLDGELEHTQFTVYHQTNHFDWHLDVGDGELKYRKLTSTLLLNEPDDYTGGELQLNAQQPRSAPRLQGGMVIFPTYILHRVTPILSGTRYSLVQWMSGAKPFT